MLRDMVGNVTGNQRCAEFAGFKGRYLLVERANAGAFVVAEYGAVDSAWNVVLGKLGWGASVDNGVVLGKANGVWRYLPRWVHGVRVWLGGRQCS